MDRAQLRRIGAGAIPPMAGNLTFERFGNSDKIVSEVLEGYAKGRGQLDRLVPVLRVPGNLMQTLYNVWYFWKYSIQYKEDAKTAQWFTDPATGETRHDILQLVQQPKALFWRGEGDCKSLSIAIAETFRAMGIPSAFRFASYGTLYPTHVYVVVVVNGKTVPVDAVWHEFGTQKSFTKKWDYDSNNMAAIYSISGIHDVGAFRPHRRPVRRFTNPLQAAAWKARIRRGSTIVSGLDGDQVSEAVMGLALDAERLQMEQLMNMGVKGIGSVSDNHYEVEILAHLNAIRHLQNRPQLAITGISGNAAEIEAMAVDGIGKTKKKAARQEKRAKKKLAKAVKKNDGKGVSKKQAKLLQKAGIEVKKRRDSLLKRVGKGILKVVTTPARLAIKTQIPKYAPFFLYQFISDPRILAKLPDAVAQKRAKAQQLRKRILDVTQMNEANFDKAVRNGIMNSFGKSPEEVIAQWIKESGYSIGVLPLIAAAGDMLKKVLGNAAEKLEQFTPAREDWGTVPDPALATEVQQQFTNNDPTTDGRSSLPQADKAYYDTTDARVLRESDPADDPDPNSKLAEEKALEEVILKSTRKTSDGNDNTFLWLGLGVLGVVAVASQSGGKKNRN